MNLTRRPPILGSLVRRREAAKTSSESGFTLIELLITMVILPFIVGALALAILAVFQLNGGTVNRINDASDAQILSTSYENDVHSAAQVTLQNSPIQCGSGSVSGTQLIALEWGANQAGGYDTVVSYVLTTGGSGSNDELVREYCTNGPSATPTSSSIVSNDMSSSISPDPATVTFTSTVSSTATGGSTTTLIDSTQAWSANQFKAEELQISGGTGAGESAKVLSNTSTSLTFAALATAPDSTSTYTVGTNPSCTGLNQGSFTTGWVDATCVTGLTLAPDEPQSNFKYSLVGVPIAAASSGKSVTPTSSSDCGFATPGSGTYASSLCFVDFTSLNPSLASSTQDPTDCPTGGQFMSAVIDYTPFVMSFCLKVSSGSYQSLANAGLQNVCVYPQPSYGSVCPAYMPTYYSPPTSEAFLGNNGFYTGVSGRPAIYTTQSPSTVNLNFYNISVKDANGNSATGWELATGDAESTDGTEDIIWSTCPSLPAFNGSYAFQSCTGPAFSLLPDNPGGSPSDDIGNACANVEGTIPNTLFPNTWLIGAGTYTTTPPSNVGTISGTTNTVECAAGSDSRDSTDKTGTVMLEAAQPSTLSIQMHGSGLQAVFVGLVLQ